MRTFAVDENNDIFIGGDGNLSIAKDQQAAKFVCEQFTRAARGEMIHKMNKGMPFFTTTFGQNTNIAQFEAAFKNRLSEIPEVITVREFNAEIIDNTLRYDALIETVFGIARLQDGSIRLPE